MYVIIEHSGTNDQTEAVQKIQEVLENDYGFTCESAVSHPTKNITLYNDELEEIMEFSTIPSEEEIPFYVRQYIIEKEDE